MKKRTQSSRSTGPRRDKPTPSRPGPAQRPRSSRRPDQATRQDPAPHNDAFVLRCAPGLARLLLAELRFAGLLRRDGRSDCLWQRNHDLVFLPAPARRPGRDDLRIAEEVHRCLIYGRYKVSQSQISRLAGQLRPEGKRWRLAVSADGKHFDRRDLARWLAKELSPHGIAIDPAASRTLFLFCVDESYYGCVPIRDAGEVAGRERRQAEREGSLPPTIAAAMAFLAKPAPGECVLDPVCGTGTLLAEAQAKTPDLVLHGIDTDREAVKAARRNLGQLPRVTIEQGDGGAISLPESSVDVVLANLPFGKQYGDPAQIGPLYSELLREMRRLAAPEGWRAVVMTSDGDALAAAAKANRLAVTKRLNVRVRGEAAIIAVLALE